MRRRVRNDSLDNFSICVRQHLRFYRWSNAYIIWGSRKRHEGKGDEMLTDKLREAVSQIRTAQMGHDKAGEREWTDKRDKLIRLCKPTELEFQWAMNETYINPRLTYWMVTQARDKWNQRAGGKKKARIAELEAQLAEAKHETELLKKQFNDLEPLFYEARAKAGELLLERGKPRWIPVTPETMPEDRKLVLVAFMNRTMTSSGDWEDDALEVHTGYHDSYSYQSNPDMWWVDGIGVGALYDTEMKLVTHYMPLPELPEEE
jgi:hypothetical protein